MPPKPSSDTIKPARHPMEIRPQSNAAKGLMMIAIAGVVLVVSALLLTTPNAMMQTAGGVTATTGTGPVNDR